MALDGAEPVVHLVDALQGAEDHAVLKSLLDGDLHVALTPADIGGEAALASEPELSGDEAHGHYDDRGEGQKGVEVCQEGERGRELHREHHHRGELREREGGDGADIEGETVEHVAAVEGLPAVEKGEGHQGVEEAAVEPVVHAHRGARLKVSRPLREEHVGQQADDHQEEPDGEVAVGGRDPSRGAVDGGLAQPDEGQHHADPHHADEGAQEGDAVESGGDAPEPADICGDAFQRR